MKHREAITLERGDDRAPVPAFVVEQLTPEEIADAEDEWFPYLLSALQTRIQQGVSRRDLPEHKHWLECLRRLGVAVQEGNSRVAVF